MNKIRAIICDLDGTLIDCTHRLHFIKSEKKDWKNFFSPDEIKKDQINSWCSELILSMNATPIFVSGRSEETRNPTLDVLGDALQTEIKHLYMRPIGDYREDSIVKEEIYKTYIEPYFNVLFCIDDRQQVVDMWRKLGLVCLQCAKGDY